MAGIDHTCIYYKNGKLLKEHSHCDFKEVPIDGDSTNTQLEAINRIDLLPYETNRDGLFMRTNENAREAFGWNADCTRTDVKLALVYPYFDNKRQERRAYKLLNKSKYSAAVKYPENCNELVYWYKSINYLVYSYANIHERYNVTFFFDLGTRDAYVTFGGYGHYNNPYLHFYHRGYGDEFEKAMACEAYRWVCEEILPKCIEAAMPDVVEAEDCIGVEDSQYYRSLCNMLNYVSYWWLSSEERDKITIESKIEGYDYLEYDPESIFPESVDYDENGNVVIY